ncbi:MAG: YncE family protein, partial [Nitrososphaeraceae archaeon]
TAGGGDNMVGNADDVVGTVNVGNTPRSIAYAQDKMLMYVTNIDDGTVTILDTAGGGDNMVGNADDVVGTVAVGNNPLDMIYAQDKMLMYVANTDDGTITILDTAGGGDNMVGNADDVLGTVSVGNTPNQIKYSEDMMLMFVGNADDDTVTILDTAGGGDNMVGNADDVVGTVAVGNGVQGIAYAQDKMLMYVANAFDDAVSIVNIPTIEKACQNSGFDTGDIRTFEFNGQTIEQITCVNFSEQCTGMIDELVTETQECIIDNYAVLVNALSSN